MHSSHELQKTSLQILPCLDSLIVNLETWFMHDLI